MRAKCNQSKIQPLKFNKPPILDMTKATVTNLLKERGIKMTTNQVGREDHLGELMKGRRLLICINLGAEATKREISNKGVLIEIEIITEKVKDLNHLPILKQTLSIEISTTRKGETKKHLLIKINKKSKKDTYNDG